MYLNVALPSVQIEMNVLDSSILCEQVCQGFFTGFFVHVGRDDDPSFNAADCNCVLRSACFAGGGFGGVGGCGAVCGVDVHIS